MAPCASSRCCCRASPYFAKNYVLPLLGVPLRTYLLVCLPVHIARSSVAVFFGDESDHLTPTRIAWLALYFSATLATSWWMLRRLRSHLGHRSHAAKENRPPRVRHRTDRRADFPV